MSKQYAQQHATKRYTKTTVNRNNDEEERAAQRAEQIAQRQAERAAQQAAAAQTEAQRKAQEDAQQRAQRAAEVNRFTQYTGMPKRKAVDSYQAMVNTTAYKANSAGYSLQDYLSDMTRYRTDYDNMAYQQQYDMNMYQSYMNRLKADRAGTYTMSDSDRKLTAARAQAIKDRYTTPKGMYTPTKEDDAEADMTGREWNQYLKMVQENRNRDPLTVERYDERVGSATKLTDEQKKLGEDLVNTARMYSTALSMSEEELKNANPMQRQAYEEARRRIDESKQALRKSGVSDADIDNILKNGVTDPAARTVQENYEYNDDRLNQLDRQARTILNRIVESNAQADQGVLSNNAMFDIYGRTNAYAERNRAIEQYKAHTGKSDEEIEKDIQAATELYNYNSMNALNQTLNEEVRANPVLAGSAVSLISTALSPVRGMNAMTEVAKAGGRADTNAPVDTNSVGYLGTNLTNMGRGAVAQTIAGDGSSFMRNLASQGYQIGMSVADSGYNMLMAGAIGDALNLAALPEKAANAAMNLISLPGFGMDAAASQLQQDQNRGISADKALKRAVAAGVIEMATEVFSMDYFWDIVQKKGPAAARSAFMNWAAQAGIEGSEEFASEILNGVADAMINGDQSEYNDNVRNYIEQGYSVEDARRKANGDFAKQAIGSFLGGAVSGGIMGGVGVYASHVRNVQSADQLKTVVQDENYKDLAEGIDTNRESYESDEAYNAAVDAKALAEKLADKQAKGKKISDAEKGKLYNMTVDLVSQAVEGGKESVDVPEDDDADVTYGEKDVPEAFRPKQNNMTAEEVSQAMVNATTPSELVEVRNAAKMSTAPGAAAMADKMYKLYSQKMVADESNSYTDVDLYYAENEMSQKDAWLAGANRVNKSGLNLSTKGEIAYNEGQRHRIRNISSSTADTASLKSFTAETIEQNPKIIDPTTGKELSKSMLQKLDMGTRNILEMAQQQQTTDAANALIQNYEKGVPVGSYQRAFTAFFDQGASGVRTFEEVLSHNNHMLSTMSEDTLKAIYNAGHSQYKALQNKAENNTVVRKGTGTVTDLRTDKSGDLTAMPLYEAYAKKTGLDIEIRDDMQEGINGSFEKSVSKITFNANSKRGHGTFFHEGIGEFASAWNSAGMKEVQDEIIRYAIDTMGTDRFSNAVRRYQSAYNQVEGYKAVRDAMDEYVNDAISGLFETEDGMGKFAKWLDGNHPEKKDTILGKIAEWLYKVIEAMQDLLSGTKRTEAARLVRTMDVKQVEALRQKALDAMDVAIENYQNAAEAGLVEDATDVRNSIDVNKPISNTRDLIAIHNLTMEQLEKTLDLKGFPSPSIAIIKAGMGHSMYGDVSVLFNKSTIDPAASKLNRVYGGDAWTPTFPSIEYKLNAKKLSAVEDKVRGLIPDEVLRSSRTGLSLDLDNATEKVNRWGNFAEAYANSDMLKYAYAMDAGIKVETPMKEARLSSKYQNPEIIGVAELFTKEQLSEMLSGGYTYMNEHPETVQMIEDKLNEIFEKKYEGRRILKGKKLYQDIGFNGWDAAVHGAYKYLDEGIQQETDTYKLIEAVDAAIDNDAYSKWVGELFDGVIEKAGIRNGQDTFTKSGNRRGWDALHDDVTLENIVKAMNREEAKGSNAFFAQSAIQAIATKNFKNVTEIKQSSGQLQALPEEEYSKIKEEHAQRAAEIVEEIYNTSGSNPYMAKDEAYQAIADALSRAKTIKGIDSALRKWGGLRIKNDTAQQVYNLAHDIANMPTGYFEAKPRRAVYLNEIASVILPDSASSDLLKRLSDAHVPYETYAAGDEAARQALMDAHEDVRFSVDAEEERVSVDNQVGEQRFSLETYKTGGRDYLINWLRKNSGLSEADQQDIVDRLDQAYEFAERLANGEELPNFSVWSRTGLNKGVDGKLLLQTYGNDGRPVQSVVVNNGEYPLNIDFTQVCKKRTTLNAVLNTLVDQYGLNLRTLTQTDINTVNALIKKHGFEIACGLCFVDAKRYRVGDWSASFANGTYSAKTGKKTKRGWNDLVRSMLKPGTTASYFNFATNERTTEGRVLSEIDDSEIRFTELDNIIRKFAKYDDQGNLIGIGRSSDKKNPTELVRMAYLLRTDPSMRHFLNQNDLIASDGLDAMRQKADPLYKLVNAHWGAGKPKLPHGFTAYGNEILRSEGWGAANNFTPEAAYKVGGVRVQSFSDFVANMFFDYMQMFADMAARKLPSHAYTKEIDYVRLFGMTGQKINMSLVPKAAEMTKEQMERYRKLANRGDSYVLQDPEFADMAMHAGLAKDENGEWTRYIWEDESFDYDDAMAIQADPRYNKNCGAIAVGVSHDHIMKMLDDDNIPMIIPYHKSGISRNIAILRNVQLYTNYTSQQTTRNANGNVVKNDFDFYGDLAKTKDPIKTADNYKAWCKEKGYTEKFREFSDHPNYYKLLIDFRVYDYNGSDPSVKRTYQPQGAVTMTFPEQGEFESIVKTALMNQQTTEDRMAGELSGDQSGLLAEVKGALGLQENGERGQTSGGTDIRHSIDVEPLSTDTRYQLEDDDFFDLFDGTDHSSKPITGFLDDEEPAKRQEFITEATKILEEGAKLMKGKPVNSRQIKNLTRNIVTEYNVTGDRKIIENNLTKVFAYLQSQGDVSYADMLGIVTDVAQDIINNSTEQVGSREEYRAMVDSLRRRKIALNAEQKQEVSNTYGSYAAFRRATFNVNVFSDKGTPLDNIWTELCDEFGGLLDYDTNTGDQPLKLMDALNAMLPRYEGNRFGKPGSATNKEAAYDLALRIIGSYYGGKSQVSMSDLSKEFRDKVRAEYDEKLRAAKEEIKERARIDIENAKVKYSWAKKENTEGKNAIEKLAELKARNREQNMRKAERQKKAKTTEAIARTVKRLYKKLYEPSKTGYDNHIPTAMQEPLAEFLSVFDFVTPDVTKFESGKYKGKWGARIYDHREGNRNIYHTITADTREEALHKVDEYIYNLMQNGGGSRDSRVWYEKMNALADLLVSENMSTDEQMSRLKMSDALIKVFKDMLSQHSHDQDVLHISQLSAEELDLVEKTIRMIDHAISKENELFSLQKKENLTGIFNQFLADAEERFKRKDKAGNTYKKTHDNYDKPNSAAYDMAWNLTNVHMLNPRTFFKTKGSGAGTMYDVLREGWNARTGDIQTAEKYTTELLDGMKISDWKKEVHTFTSREGKQVKMTIPQIMTLYELQKRPAARNHLPGGFKMSRKVNTVGGVKNVVQDQAVHFDNGLMAQIFEVLTPEQIRVADGLQKFFVDYCSKWNNEVSERLYGFQMFTEPNYFPMHVDKTTVNTNNADVNVLINGIENMGMTKAVKKEALNALIIEDIFDVYVQHVVDSANYHGYAAPISDLLRWFNYRQTSTTNGIRVTQSTKETMKTYYGEASNQYIVKLIQDLNGEAKVDAEAALSEKLLSHYKAAAVGANVRVAIQQPTAYLRAANVIDMKYLLPALRTNPLKLEQKSKYAMEHNKSAYWKSHGYYDSMLGQSMEQIILGESSLLDKLEEGASILAQKGDDWTWGVLYAAVEREIKGQNPGIDVNSETYRQKVNERFDDVIDQTQVIDSVLHRTQMMRSTNAFVKMEMAFQAEPQKTYNMLYTALVSGDKKQIMRAGITFISTGMLTAAAAALIDAFRDKDEEKDWSEKYLASLLENAKDNLNVLALFPYVKDVISTMQGYDVERVDTQGLVNLVESATKFAEWVNKWRTGAKNSQTLYGAIKNVVRAFSQASGIPIYNALRTYESVNNTIRQYLNPNFGLDLTTYTKSKSQQEKEQRQKEYAELYDVIDMGGDPAAVIGQMIAGGKTIKDLNSAIAAEYKTLYGDADEEDRAKLHGTLVKALTTLGDEAAEDTLKKWAGSAVGYDALDAAMAVGESFEDEVHALLDAGKTADGIKSHLRSLYADDLKYRRDNGLGISDEEELIVDVLVAAGSSAADAEDTLEKWSTGQAKEDGYTSKYADIYTAIDDGSLNGLSTAITESLKENEAKNITASITKHYKEQYLETKDSALYQRLITAYRQLGMTEDEAKEKIKGWSDEGTGGKKLSGMTALYAAIDSGDDFDAAMNEALNGRESWVVMKGVTSTYRDQYVASRDPVLYERLIATYMALGKTREEAEEKIQKWIEDAEQGY